MRGRRRRLPGVFVPAVVFVLGGLLVMHGIDGSHATPDMSMASPAADAAGTPVGPAASPDPAAASEAGIVPVWSSGADHTVGDTDSPGTGIVLGDVAMACIAVLFTLTASVGFGAALARAHSRVAGCPSAAVAIRRAVQTAWQPPAPATHERCVLIC